MGHLKFMGHDLDPNKAHVNIEVRFETFGFLPFFIAGQEGTCYLRIENVGEKEIPKTDFRWEIESEKTKLTGKPYFDIPQVELLNFGDSTDRKFRFKPPIPGLYKLSIFVIDEEKRRKIGLHSGYEHFEGDRMYRIFEAYSWYIIGVLIGTVPVGILASIEIFLKIIHFFIWVIPFLLRLF